MKKLHALPILAFLCLVSCGPSSPGSTPFFDVDVSWTLVDATGKPTTCAALGATKVIATLFQADTPAPNTQFADGTLPCTAGVAVDAGTSMYVQITGFGGHPYDLYVQALDSKQNLVGFFKQDGAVPANVPDTTTIPIVATLKPPSPAGCGDGSTTGKKCDDFGNNACCNCAPCP